ncbi:beta-lactamase family protein [Cellulophaga baltica]|uniref:serine hydrolase domain-containing protein n=1 Tax=Cellulophaga TaxID=104264 RepID=UPI001C06F3DD|nr:MULTISPECIES: serine hydrolase [Cellulophaga]MBU2998037.1 beta-lactamase family protein [Cellulophaga baltica]MDO6769438.1 serine hydrolase [Cellulophaga sp. 1_MG-2023]
MKLIQTLFTTFLVLFSISCSSDNSSDDTQDETTEETTDESLYFPPLDSDTWETETPESLSWNEAELDALLTYLEEKNTKSFIMLHNGKIVVESYMNDHSATTSWYWASAGKTLTGTVTGIAQDEGLIAIDNKVSDYIGTGWTSATLEEENLITCKNLLQMDSGLDDSLGDDVSPENLVYIADAGTRWAYHNVYVKIQDVVATASNETWSEYFNTALKEKIGMSGTWIPLDDLSVYWSDTRSMARFGLLIAANGNWDGTQIVSESFLTVATNTSQEINEAYGYFWWLNGKSTYHLPSTQYEFSGSLIPNAPNDMYAALGKNDQKIYVIPSKDLVIIRMGQAADSSNFALSDFDNDLWEKINAVID